MEYRRNIVESYKSKWMFWKHETKYFYDYVLNNFETSFRNEDEPNIFYMADVTKH